MKIFKMPERVKAILFDMDGTLYTHPEYLRFQIDASVKRLAALRGLSFEDMEQKIAAYRTEWASAHNGRQISLGNVFKAFGVSIEESIRWREELYEPAEYLKADPELRKALLRSRAKLAVVTNNPVLVARKTLEVLGVADCFSAIVGLDTCLASKPDSAPFLEAVRLCGAPPEECLAVGDRADLDIAPCLQLGMGGVLVSGAEEVYQLLYRF
ncbi:MAG: HAD family hydrolase [Spirochaetaceae bacterium]|jgi:phosphoglycolate phosphatase/putative hydrolase of the HAD superfamily|nr:HAD family hydrolase [Spirochaetaceae bacterium]